LSYTLGGGGKVTIGRDGMSVCFEVGAGAGASFDVAPFDTALDADVEKLKVELKASAGPCERDRRRVDRPVLPAGDLGWNVDATIATGELVVRVADDVNQDGFISPLDALLLINGAPGGVVGASVSVFDAADLLVATGLTTANPSPLVLVLPVGCYRVEAGDRDTPLLSIPSIDGHLCLSSGGRESATFLDVPASTDGGG